MNKCLDSYLNWELELLNLIKDLCGDVLCNKDRLVTEELPKIGATNIYDGIKAINNQYLCSHFIYEWTRGYIHLPTYLLIYLTG